MSKEAIPTTGEAIVLSVLPDICWTPLGPLQVPVPYPIIARFDLSIEAESTVQLTGFDSFTMRSRITQVTGDEAGTGGGLISGVNRGYCRPVTASSSVVVGDEFLLSHTSDFLMNCAGPDGPGNTMGKAVYVKVQSFVWLDENACFLGDPSSDELDYSRFDQAIDYMFSEMMANSDSDVVHEMKGLLDPAPTWYQLLLGTYSPGRDKLTAMFEWAWMVHQGGKWDHKPKLDEMLHLKTDPAGEDYWFPVRGDTVHEYNYDIWSNIHYGYVGTAAGFDETTLQKAAGSGLPFVGRNDEGDVVTVQIGIDLWKKYGRSLTKQELQQAIQDHLCDLQKAAEVERNDRETGVVITATNKR